MKADLILQNKELLWEVAKRSVWPDYKNLPNLGLPMSVYVGGVKRTRILKASGFRELRDLFRATVVTDEPEKMCQRMGVPIGEPGIVRPGGN